MLTKKVWIFSPLEPQEARRLSATCDEEIVSFIAEGETWLDGDDEADGDEDWEGLNGGWPLPFADELRAKGVYYGVEVAPAIRDRLLACRSGFELPVALDGSLTPLAASAIRFLLERTGEGCVDWGDHRPVVSADALVGLGLGLEGFGEPHEKREPPRVPGVRPDQEETFADLFLVLREQRLLETTETFDPAKAARAFRPPREDVAAALIEWLVDRDDVIEVYASEDDVDRLLDGLRT